MINLCKCLSGRSLEELNSLNKKAAFVIIIATGIFFFHQQLHLNRFIGFGIAEAGLFTQALIQICCFLKTKKKTLLGYLLLTCLFMLALICL